jgi:hypothetical protein
MSRNDWARGSLILRSEGARKIKGLSLVWPFKIGDVVAPSRDGLNLGIRPCLAKVTALVITGYTYGGDLRLIRIRRCGSLTDAEYHVSFWKKAKRGTDKSNG